MNDDEVDDGYGPSEPRALLPRWEKWFAWKPVKVHGQRVWMRTIYRTRTLRFTEAAQGMAAVWVYGDIFDVLKTDHGTS